ncbi:carbohydrate ABC transporter substrate-binding protein (CUT1 family) [Thermosporothrix hazakensis]|jgi:multiple sugar transport system substrate-binding protein|uniref:Carbohydrate ABC transporter substrate-binding protein (CUT1 family) n=2 Tax=Thermosporothrix TaxID=768650 RepID=A0A326U2F0_THEHA|nr:ABC transporter substrate-binding protein [Thermosporothrix hazakensis]PZW25622.1 carbohydrate ABC transporter substrate-binding protein (CUT1 family) [Thermosporothrix hazakensis]BBH89917.1 putative ABC transporter-binding protein [Thermosporothrix sp. COM3]GCE48117.1 putative ABC transporter-binding protein [Thermosporothrix hazakensis]
MFREQREALDEIVTKMRSGRMKRRTFMERALAVGLTASAAMSLLEACGGDTPSGSNGTVNLVWQSESDKTDTYKNIVEEFNKTVGKEKNIHVTWQNGPNSTDEMMTKYNNMFRARNAEIDIISVDIVYPAMFAEQEWTVEITDSMWPSSERQKYLSAPIAGCTYNGKLWAAPFRTDLGLLYYRTDLMKNAPQTFDELVSISKDVAPSKVQSGYVWQGSQYEGLVCNFCEVLHGYGGAILDPNDAKKVTVNTPEAVDALTMMASWVGSVSPAAVTTYTEDQSHATWAAGNAAFMRNWPYAWVIDNDPKQSKVAQKFAIASLPHGSKESAGHSAIGGWNLAINAFSKHQDEAWEFIKYMLSAEAQKKAVLSASWAMVLQSIYDDSDVQSKIAFYKDLKPILQNAKPRPVSPKYTTVSESIQRHVYSALKKSAKPDQAIKSLADDLQRIVQS